MSSKEVYDQKTFAEAAEPLIKWLNDNACPHASVIVTPKTAELVTGEIVHVTEKFLKD